MGRCCIKICGITREKDVELVGGSGADFIGLLVDMPSPRSLTSERAAVLAKLSAIDVVLLFFDAPADFVEETVSLIRPCAVQLQGHETPDYLRGLRNCICCEIWKGVHLPATGQGEADAGAVMQRVRDYWNAGADRILLDTVVKSEGGGVRMGGTGVTSDWRTAADVTAKSPLPVILAGGLKPGNVADAIRMVRPAGVDLASGVESSPGVKDPDKVAAFVKAVREAESD